MSVCWIPQRTHPSKTTKKNLEFLLRFASWFAFTSGAEFANIIYEQ
jgi:hypothetical protein